MDDLLQKLCKKQKHDLYMTNQDISDESGVPISTVSNFLSGQSKQPSIYTVGPICAALNISLDEFFGICPEPKEDYCTDLKAQYSEPEEATKSFRKRLFRFIGGWI